ncbi:MAG: ATP-binding protein [Candidatus Tectomicrobia bacterium]|uniref:ATP-binding protein n=1 Tax=Tectimicrobiota bacterium TaxID=2528274 RepID=A0A932GRE5_UNCTE|nr:ATP-binding protein [Candidatus Tectomicrobia bacterium]
MEFIDRERELSFLETQWKRSQAQLIILYGKRRVGKTELIHRFLQKKPAVYYVADRRPEPAHLKELAARFSAFFRDEFLSREGFSDWLSVFAYLKRKVREPFIWVIDEFPYLAENNRAISSLFQKGWDETLRHLPIFLILCGSSISMMESETLAHKAPLYGRRTGQIFLEPMGFYDAWKFFPKTAFEDFLYLYAVLGGTPAYLIRFDPEESLEENIRSQIFTKEEFLHREVEYFLREELREPRNYLAILKAVTSGKRKFGEIVNDTQQEKNTLTKYLHVLEDLHLIEKEVPATEKNPQRSKKGLYRLQDPFFVFWFEYVFPHKSDLELGETAVALRAWRRTFDRLVASTYERVSAHVVRKHEEDLFPLQRIGRWWDRNQEIDLVGVNDSENAILFGEAKWSTKPVGTDIYESLQGKARQVEWGKKGRKEHFCLFSRSSFTPAMKRLAQEQEVLLFHRDRLLPMK